jgi:hypothetical protein
LLPSVVVISNGNHATFQALLAGDPGHLRGVDASSVVFQTHKCLRTAPCANVPDAQIADPETTDENGTILITANAATSTYTVQHGTTTRMFTVKLPERQFRPRRRW